MNANEHRVRITDEVKLDVPTLRHNHVNVYLMGLMVRRAFVLSAITSFENAYDICRAYISGLQQILQVDVRSSLVLKTASLQCGDDGTLYLSESLRSEQATP
ncbi:hypothetical protein [Bordetella sp. LUAb4]|uniref:hypothetical protein n=1 Tax=Bordetella sp. LUAb4 TaxID=2843195 RepID=UPI001E2BA2F7|nr:hypothetical protein [Bordetella sp. LUAb4]